MSAELNIGAITESMGSTTGPEGLGREATHKIEREMRENGLVPGGAGAGGPENTDFSQVLEKSLNQVNDYQVQANTAIQELVAGRTKNIHETMLAIERADTSLKLAMQVRNKILDAYREIMRMQV